MREYEAKIGEMVLNIYYYSYNNLKYVKGGKLVDYTCCEKRGISLLNFTVIQSFS